MSKTYRYRGYRFARKSPIKRVTRDNWQVFKNIPYDPNFAWREKKALRHWWWNKSRKQNKINIKKGREIELPFGTCGWLTW